MTALRMISFLVVIFTVIASVDGWCTPFTHESWQAWSSCTESCGGGTHQRVSSGCLVSDDWQTGDCNQFCYNAGSFYGDQCHCKSWRTGRCCSTCRHIHIANCKPGQQQCGGNPDNIRCTDCEMPYTPAGWGKGCRRLACNERNGGCEHTCLVDRGTTKCVCRSGYALSSNGYSCHDINECSSGAARCDHKCVNSVGSFHCLCRDGYQLDSDGHTCSDVDECVTGTASCDQRCVNTPGSYYCECSTGYILSSDRRTCKDTNECSVNNGGCGHICVNEKGSFHCECRLGFRLDLGQKTCSDVDECKEGTSRCDQLCHNTNGSYTCSCRHGYNLQADGYSCQDVDDCVGVVCAHSGTCKDNVGSFTCSCVKGFTGQHCENDIDECLGFLNGGCEEVCLNTFGTFHCSCSGNKTLNADGFSCEGDKNSLNVFERHGLVRKLLPRGCSTIVLTKCSEGGNVDVILSSTSPWYQLQSNNSVVYTFGIVFVEVNFLSLPISITGIEIVKSGGSFAIIYGSLAYSSSDGRRVGKDRKDDCASFSITPRDVHDFLTSYSFLKTFIENVEKHLPDWLSFSYEGTEILGVNDLQTALVHGNNLQTVGCQGAPLHEDRLYTVIKFGGKFSLSVYGNKVVLPEPLRNDGFCMIIDICRDFGGTMFLMIPEGSREILNKIEMFSSFRDKYGIDVRPVGLGLSLFKHINVQHMATPLNFWNGDNFFSYRIMPEANVWVGGEALMKFGNHFTFEMEAQGDIYASVPGITSILKSVFLERWEVLLRLKILGTAGLHFKLFGEQRSISLNVAKADIDAYASLGGLTPRQWCGPNANPPGVFLSVLLDANPFIGIPILQDWIFDLKIKTDVYFTSDPSRKVSSANNIDILHDIIDVRGSMELFVNTTLMNVLRYSSVLMNTSQNLLNDLKVTATGIIRSITKFLDDVKNGRDLPIDRLIGSITDLWHNGWKRLENSSIKFVDSIEHNTVIAKYNFSNLLQLELIKIKSNFHHVIAKLAKQASDVLSEIDGFGFRFTGVLKIFHLKIAGLDIQMAYSSGKLGSCGRFNSVYDLLKDENAFRVYAVASTGLIKLAPFIRLDVGDGVGLALSIDTPGKMIVQLHAQASLLGISGSVDVFLSERGHYFYLEGKLWNTFKAQLKISFEYGKDWDDLATLDVQGRLLANSGDDDSFEDSYLDAFRKLNQKLADEAEKRISGVQHALSFAQGGLSQAQGWLEEKKSTVRSANAAFDNAVRAMDKAKEKLEEAKGPFRNALSTLNEAQRKVDNLCRIRNCRQICVPGIKCKICWKKILFVKIPYPCCHFTSCMFSFPDPVCVVINVGCRALRAVAYAALEVAKVAVRIPMLALDAAKLAVTGAQFIVDKSRVVLDVAVAAMDLAEVGLEGAKVVLEGAKVAFEAVKKVVGWGLKALDFIIKYGVQSLIDIRNCGFETRISLTGTTVFHVECEINVFRSGFRKVRLGINFGNPIQSIWQAAKGTVDAVVDASRQSERTKRELRSQTLTVLHKVLREIRNADIDDHNFDVFVNETIDAILYTSGFRENSTGNDYDNRVMAFKEKCDTFSRVHSFFSEAIQVLFELTNETADTFGNVSSMQDSLAGYSLDDLKGNVSMSTLGINPDVAKDDFNISTDDIANVLANVKQNLNTDPLLLDIGRLTEDAKELLNNQTNEVANLRITDQWQVVMSNVTHQFFSEDECVTFQDCSHFGVFLMYSLFEAENITELAKSLDALSAFEDLLLKLSTNTTRPLQEVNHIAQLLSEKLYEIKNHNYFCSSAPTIRPSANVTVVTSGSTLNLSCNATGSPQPNIWWYHEDYYIESGSTLVIHNVSEEHALTYYCIAGNLVANISSEPMEVVVLDEDSSVSWNNMATLQPNKQSLSLTNNEKSLQVDWNYMTSEEVSDTNLAVILGVTLSVLGAGVLVGVFVFWRAHARKKSKKADGVGSFVSLNIVRPDTQRSSHFQTRINAFTDTLPAVEN